MPSANNAAVVCGRVRRRHRRSRSPKVDEEAEEEEEEGEEEGGSGSGGGGRGGESLESGAKKERFLALEVDFYISVECVVNFQFTN